jgi:CRISPR system Cascade subunit CasB
MERKQMYYFLKEPAIFGRLLAWRKSIDEKPGERARLRRAESPDDVLLSEAFLNFLQKMPEEWSESNHLPASALIATVLAHANVHEINQYETISFATQLATTKDGGEKPRMSELRFQQLQKSHDPNEFSRRIVRAVKMLDGNVNLFSLANDILHWMHEYRKGIDRNPQKRLAFCWASDYYRALPKKQSK